MSSRSSVLVLGAGPSGLGAALALGRDATVLERGGDLGGLCRTIVIDGAVFDPGGHSFHTPHPEIRDLVFGALPMYEQKREARCWCAGQLIDYPFQSHFDQLDDPTIAQACAEGLARSGDTAGAADFGAYLSSRFGEGIARHFLLPYNRKLWGSDLSRLAVDWASERVAAASAAEDREGDEGRRRPLREQTTVAYPARGGFGEIFRALAERVPDIRFDQEIETVDTARRIVTTVRGDRHAYDQLVSTLPLPDLIARLTAAPAWMAEEAARLEAISLALVFLVIGHPVDTCVQRVYCGDAHCPVHKFVFNHTSSPWLRGRPHHGILAEVSIEEARGRTDLADGVVRTLVAMKLLRSARHVRSTQVRTMARAYPAPTHDRPRIVGRLLAWLAGQGIHSVGRFGEWAYINSDEALHRGLSLGRRLRAS